jgi:hypothetical protein
MHNRVFDGPLVAAAAMEVGRAEGEVVDADFAGSHGG